MLKFVIIGNKTDRRVTFFEEAAGKYGSICEVVSYLDLIHQKKYLGDYLGKDVCLRIESFGEDFETYKNLIALGEQTISDEPFSKISATQALKLPFDKGFIQYQRQFYLGFCVFLEQINKALLHFPETSVLNTPDSIMLAFDKIRCQQYLSQNAVAIPPILGIVWGYDHLQELLTKHQYSQVFVKPSHSSSGSGVMAYRKRGNKEQLTSSIELVYESGKPKLYNNLRVRKYENHKEIKDIVDTMAQEYIFAEKWLPKASSENGVFDIRVVVIDGKACQTVIRESHTPITNLHLGNKRGNIDAIIENIGLESWGNIKTTAEKAASTIPGTFYTGADVLLDMSHQKAIVLELNAFGDLLPNILWEGKNTYETTVERKQQLVMNVEKL